MATVESPKQFENDGELSAEDKDYIEYMAMWYGISPGEAYLRFCHGNIDGLLDEDDEEYEM